MPRIYDSFGDPIDYCRSGFPTLQEARALHDNPEDLPEEELGPDGRGNCFAYNAEHPPYQGEGYKCFDCGVTLTDDDT